MDVSTPRAEMTADNCQDLSVAFGRGLNADVLGAYQREEFDGNEIWEIHIRYLNGAGSANHRNELSCDAEEFLESASSSFSKEFKDRVHEYTPVPGSSPQRYTRDYSEWYSVVLDMLDQIFTSS